MTGPLLIRSIDGAGNNLPDPLTNATGSTFERYAPAYFADGIHVPVSGTNPRTISNVVVGEGDAAVANTQGLSGMMYAWGQFIDHDLTRTPSDGITHFDIAVPAGDPIFTGAIAMTRAIIGAGTGTDPAHPAAAVNRVTGWLDASMIYGSDAVTAAALRLPDGRMRVSDGNNLPIEHGSFFAGDVRAAENPSLTALQTLFVREHNWQVARLHAADSSLTGDALYEQARAIVAAEIAHITYDEFLPHLLGQGAIQPWHGYDSGVDAQLRLEFVGAAWRWGHSTVSNETERKSETGEVIGPELMLRQTFFMPPADFSAYSGADGFLRHLATDRSQAMDARIVDDLRNFLFDPPVGMDLAAINIQRGRDLGLATLNQAREAMGLASYTDFAQITGDAATVAALRSVYASVDDIDLWTGGLAERLMPGASIGETFGRVIAAQFTALRDGDRFWYQNQGFDTATLDLIGQTSLSDIIRRNTGIEHLQDDVFVFFERRAADVAAEVPDAPQLVLSTASGQVLDGGPLGDLLIGRDGAQILVGGAGNDTIEGGDGHDLLRGGADDDVLMGGRGRDRLEGGPGDDVLVGGAGADELFGGAGHDLFRYSDIAGPGGPDAPDIVLDFRHGEDRVDLSALGPLDWIGGHRFTGHGFGHDRAGEVRVEAHGAAKMVTLQIDVDGDGRNDLMIQFRGITTLTESDLLM